MSSRAHVPTLLLCLLAVAAAGVAAAVAGCAMDAPTALEARALSADRGAQSSCSNVSGTDLVQLTSPTTAVGTWSGDISGTGEAVLDELQASGEGALHFKAHGSITTASGDHLFVSEEDVLGPVDPPRYRADGRFDLLGGTGIYANVSGALTVHGDVDLGTGAGTLFYVGTVCFGS
jgi:hypothetical protein